LGGRKGIRPVKTEWWGAGMVICLEQSADLYMAQLMPLPLIVSCFRKIQIGFTFLVPAHMGSPGKKPLNGCVCVCVLREGLKAYAVGTFCRESGSSFEAFGTATDKERCLNLEMKVRNAYS